MIRKHRPCTEGWKKLMGHVGPYFPEDGHIALGTILESNGLDDALWCLRAVLPEQERDRDRLARLFACDCAEGVLHIYEKECPDDKRPADAVRVARAFAEGKATWAERDAAWAAARAAAGVAATDAAWAAAAAAARDAAMTAAWVAAMTAARDATWAATGSAAGNVARDAAWNAARNAQKEKFQAYFCHAEVEQLGNFMGGKMTIDGHAAALSGSCGSDGLPKSVPAAVPDEGSLSQHLQPPVIEEPSSPSVRPTAPCVAAP